MAGNSKESEQYRLNMLRHSEHIVSGAPPSEVTEAEQTIANYRKKQSEARESIARLRSPLPKPNLCPECWFMHGLETQMHAVPHEDPEHWDRWKCRKCSYDEDRAAR